MKFCFVEILIVLIFVQESIGETTNPIVIAHRGASGYLPEHTLAAKALAYGQDADYLEQDVVLSKDNVPIVLHDIYLDEVTNVATMFPNRKRSNGRFYAIDFTLNEIKSLRATERFHWNTGIPFFPKRFPLNRSHFRLVTLAEELEFVAGLNKQSPIHERKHVGVYVEIKEPEFHKTQNRSNFSEIVLDLLKSFNYTKQTDLAFLQCFGIEELRRIRLELKSDLKLVALLLRNEDRTEYMTTDFNYWMNESGIQELSTFANGIGPHYSLLYTSGLTLEPSSLFQYARAHKLFIHPYTFRTDMSPEPFTNWTKFFEYFIDQLKIDGFFIDQPDKAVDYLRQRQNPENFANRMEPCSFVFFFLIFCLLPIRDELLSNKF